MKNVVIETRLISRDALGRRRKVLVVRDCSDALVIDRMFAEGLLEGVGDKHIEENVTELFLYVNDGVINIKL